MKKLILAMVVLGLLAVACETQAKTSAAESSRKVTEAYQAKLEKAVPYPLGDMNDSLERRQLREKLLRFNKPTKVAYVTLLGDTGNVVASFPIRGKVSSVNSMMTASEIWSKNCYTGGCSREPIEAPTDDGSYGTNGDAVFFFTTANVYVEWNGRYILTDAPLEISSSPIVLMSKDAKPSSVGVK